MLLLATCDLFRTTDYTGTPLWVDAAPLAPACLLYLDAISWFDQREGSFEAQVP